MTVPGHVALPEAESVGWAEFEAARAGFDSRFAETQPMSVLPGGMKAAAAPAPRPARARSYTVDEVMVLARRNNRVCPRPGEWERLYELLPNKRRTSHGWQPSAPLVGGAWSFTSWMLERLTLREHIEWASSQGVLPSVHALLRDLPEEAWLHMGESTDA